MHLIQHFGAGLARDTCLTKRVFSKPVCCQTMAARGPSPYSESQCFVIIASLMDPEPADASLGFIISALNGERRCFGRWKGAQLSCEERRRSLDEAIRTDEALVWWRTQLWRPSVEPIEEPGLALEQPQILPWGFSQELCRIGAEYAKLMSRQSSQSFLKDQTRTTGRSQRPSLM